MVASMHAFLSQYSTAERNLLTTHEQDHQRSEPIIVETSESVLVLIYV